MKATVQLTPLQSGRWMAKVIHHGKLMSGGIYETQPAAVAGATAYAAALTNVSLVEVITLTETPQSEDGAMAAGGAR